MLVQWPVHNAPKPKVRLRLRGFCVLKWMPCHIFDPMVYRGPDQSLTKFLSGPDYSSSDVGYCWLDSDQALSIV